MFLKTVKSDVDENEGAEMRHSGLQSIDIESQASKTTEFDLAMSSRASRRHVSSVIC